MGERKTLKTRQMPNYVWRYYGSPLRLYRLSRGRYKISGPKHTDIFDADNAADARDVARNIARYALNIKDRRVLK